MFFMILKNDTGKILELLIPEVSKKPNNISILAFSFAYNCFLKTIFRRVRKGYEPFWGPDDSKSPEMVHIKLTYDAVLFLVFRRVDIKSLLVIFGMVSIEFKNSIFENYLRFLAAPVQIVWNIDSEFYVLFFRRSHEH